jgi:predicted DNA-binding protein with PD1-like motif
MQVRALDGWGWFVVLDVGDEIVESLTSLAARESIRGAHVSGIGGLRSVTLGFFDPAEQEYRKRTFEEPLELGALVGNLGLVEDKPFLHAHATVSGPELIAYTGHLVEAVIGVTGELLVQNLPCALPRRLDEAIGLKLIDLETPDGDEAEAT